MRRVLFGVILVALLFLTVFPVTASYDFADFDGNYNGSYKIDPPVSKVIFFDDSGQITNRHTETYVDFIISDTGQELSFTTKGILVTSLFLKGGNAYRIYSFGSGIQKATGLTCPDNGGGITPRISHYGLDQTVLLITDPSQPTDPLDSSVSSETSIQSTESESMETSAETKSSESEASLETSASQTSTVTYINNSQEIYGYEMPNTGNSLNIWLITASILLFLCGIILIVLYKYNIFNIKGVRK